VFSFWPRLRPSSACVLRAGKRLLSSRAELVLEFHHTLLLFLKLLVQGTHSSGKRCGTACAAGHLKHSSHVRQCCSSLRSASSRWYCRGMLSGHRFNSRNPVNSRDELGWRGFRGLVFKADPVLWTRSLGQAADAIHGCPLSVLQSEVVVHCKPELLLAAQIVLSCLNRGVSVALIRGHFRIAIRHHLGFGISARLCPHRIMPHGPDRTIDDRQDLMSGYCSERRSSFH
jgi:hypothetical protein